VTLESQVWQNKFPEETYGILTELFRQNRAFPSGRLEVMQRNPPKNAKAKYNQGDRCHERIACKNK
jgi:hypothetical protein